MEAATYAFDDKDRDDSGEEEEEADGKGGSGGTEGKTRAAVTGRKVGDDENGSFDDEDENSEDEVKRFGDEVSQRIEKPLGEPVVFVRALEKSFNIEGRDDTVVALHDISLSHDSPFKPIRAGEFIMIRGPSGGGKTTLLNILGTIDDPTAGYVELFGERIDRRSTDTYLADLRLRKIGFVFQTFNLIATMSAFENVLLPMTILGELSPKEAKKRAVSLLDRVGLLDRLEHLPSELSGGEQQRVTIARALANMPEVLLLDEPTGDLDTKNTLEIMELLLEINQKEATTCIMVTHNPDLECYADRILYVEDGTFVRQAVNTCQVKIDYETYLYHIDSQKK